mmetsp:Transcript_24064/g.35603  ORF Transcript_24064/g.35603 Transcript_24064/m.35603 type:complete len:232 (+) Transcript_24064:495-1190(+)
MKLFSLIIATTFFAVSAFGVSPVSRNINRQAVRKAPLRKDSASTSPLFRDAAKTRGGAVPGWAAYNGALDKKPILTKALTSLAGFAIGDFLAQAFLSNDPLNWVRLIKLAIFGFIYHGPSGHYFYNWLDGKIEGTDGKSVATKVAIDQIFWCPIFMTVFFSYLGLVNGDSFSTITNKIKNDLLSACQGSWKVWPIVHAVNFKFIQNKHRLIFINGVQIAFNMFLSLIGSKA